MSGTLWAVAFDPAIRLLEAALMTVPATVGVYADDTAVAAAHARYLPSVSGSPRHRRKGEWPSGVVRDFCRASAARPSAGTIVRNPAPISAFRAPS